MINSLSTVQTIEDAAHPCKTGEGGIAFEAFAGNGKESSLCHAFTTGEWRIAVETFAGNGKAS